MDEYYAYGHLIAARFHGGVRSGHSIQFARSCEEAIGMAIEKFKAENQNCWDIQTLHCSILHFSDEVSLENGYLVIRE